MGWLLFDTAIGTCGLAWNDVGLVGFQLPEPDLAATRARLVEKAHLAETPMAEPASVPAWVEDAVANVTAHLAGQLRDLGDVPIDFSQVSPFNAEVLRALQRVPPGQTVTYGELAARVGAPDASRAIGRAMATNPFPIVVPCHRVVAAVEGRGGFSAYGGLVTKEKLLRLEGAIRQTTLF